jgi:ankyrin repeat protein
MKQFFAIAAMLPALLFMAGPLPAQVSPSPVEIAGYEGLHRAAAAGDAATIRRLAETGAELDATDSRGRTAVMVAAHLGHREAAKALLDAGADVNRLDLDRYDVITIAAVADDPEMIEIALAAGGDPTLITSRYDGTALIATAHLGHDGVVRTLIDGGAPLDHINNLAWTALIEAIVLGNGGPRHVATVEALMAAGADVNLPDGRGASPLTLARARGYDDIVRILEAAGAKP